MIRERARGKGTIGAIVLGSVFLWNTASAVPTCHARLTVELTPDVPNPTDMGFLGSLLSNQVGYQLILRRKRTDTLLVLDLTGPGPGYGCRNAIDAIRRDGHVLSVHVNEAPSFSRNLP